MRWAIAVLAFGLCLTQALAQDYITKNFFVPRDATDPDNPDNFQNIRYMIKVPANFPPNGPVFYGTAGRVNVADIKDQYDLFDQVSYDYDNAIVVYVEQRFFGASTVGDVLPIRQISDLEDLVLENVINDNVELIKYLSDKYKTKNFLVFGAGHGGIIAGYLANKFATDKDLTNANYKVLGWSSSPPIKYFRQDTDFRGADFQELNKQFASLLTASTGGCDVNTIPKFRELWTFLRGLTTADQTLVNALNVEAPPSLKANAAAEPTDEMKQFIVFWRNQLLGLAYDNRLYDRATSNRVSVSKFRNLCNALDRVVAPITSGQVNDVFAAIVENTDRTTWRLVKANGDWDRDLALKYWQDCTQQQILSCPKDATDDSDPFTNTQWDPSIPCNSLRDFNRQITAECTGLFPGIVVFNYQLNPIDFPRSLTKNVITTVNKQSMFYGSYKRFKNEKNENRYAYNWDVWGIDNWEFEAPKQCDTEKVKDVRYLVFRAFGCFTGLISNSGGVCNNLFNDGNNYRDNQPGDSSCPDDTSDAGSFPWGHSGVKFQNPGASHTSTPKFRSSTPLVPRTSTGRSTPKGSTSAPSGSASIVPMISLVFSTLFVWFTATSLL